MLNPQVDRQQPISLSVRYVTTEGSAVNSRLKPDSSFLPPSGFDSFATRQIAPPILGSDEVLDRLEIASLTRYYLTTNDRLVTPADLKLFCYNELLVRFGITRSMVKSVMVSHRQQRDHWGVGYEVLVEIVLVDNNFIRRGFEDKIPQTETLLQAMMSVRSTNIYPIVVTIQIEKKSK